MKKEEIFQIIGNQIASLRKAKNMTQLDLAMKLNVSQAMITAYETGKRGISVSRLLEMAEILNVLPDEILGVDIQTTKKPGPASRLEKQVEQIKKLPKKNQQYVSTFLEQVLATAK